MPSKYALWYLRAGHGGGLLALSWQCHGIFRGHLGRMSLSSTTDPGTEHFKYEIAMVAGLLSAVGLSSWEEEIDLKQQPQSCLQVVYWAGFLVGPV